MLYRQVRYLVTGHALLAQVILKMPLTQNALSLNPKYIKVLSISSLSYPIVDIRGLGCSFNAASSGHTQSPTKKAPNLHHKTFSLESFPHS